MDLVKILAELKAAQDDFRQSDKAFATATFCQQICKVLDEIVKGTKNEEFENLVFGIWIIISSVNDLLPQLIDGPLLTELAEKLFRQCARVVLDIKWQQLDPSEESRQNLENSLSICHQYMAPRGFTRFGTVNALMAEPWTDPTLSMVMGSEEDNEEGEGLAYIKAQDPEILKLRVDLMYQENCDEFALNLCSWCLKHPALAADFTLHKIKFILLHRLGCIDRLQEECQSMGLVDSNRLINRLHGKEEHKELCTMLAQTFLIQNWIKPSDDDSKMELLRLWIRVQYQADENHENFISNLWAVAKVSRSTEQLLFIIDAVREKCGDTFLQFYLDLCIFAINVDKGCWEKLKESNNTGPKEELTARKRDMAQVCDKLAHIVSHVSPKIAFCCVLTSFAMMPSEQSLQAVCDGFQRKSQAERSARAQCCSNCAADQGECLQHENKASRDVNVATLYEVERLCTMLRPSYLSCDSDFASLVSLCKQYLRKEKGEPVRSALLPQKARHQQQETSPAVPGIQVSEENTKSMQSQQKPAILRRTVDASSNVNNVAIPPASDFVHGSVKSPVGRMTSAVQPAAASTHIIQQLVLNQLPSDTVQILLDLIHSKKVSPVHLNHIMTKNPEKSVQILQNLVNHFKQAGVVKPDTDEQRLQQHAQQSPQMPQKLPEQQAAPKQLAVQQHLKVQGGTPALLQSANMASAGLVKKEYLTSNRSQCLQHNMFRLPGTGQTRMAGRMAQGQATVSQLYPQQQSIGAVRAQYPAMVQKKQQIQPAVPSLSTLHLSDTREVKGASVQVMTLKQPTLMQTSSSRAQTYTSSKVSTHMSGGNVISLQKTLPPACIPSVPGAGCVRSSGHPRLVPKMVKKETEEIVARGRFATASSQVSPNCSESAGNRHYSINNLLFTGEQQNSTLSITLPDTLPEISVDSISDTLQALSGSPQGGSQVMLTGPVTQVSLSASLASDAQLSSETSLVTSVPFPHGQDHIRSAAVQISVPSETVNTQHSSVPLGSLPFSTNPVQDSNACRQSLPSFSSLFVSNPSALRVSLPISSALPSTAAFVPETAVIKTSQGQIIGQKIISKPKAENVGAKKTKEWLVTDKEKMMQVLKQAMTIKVEKKTSLESPAVAVADTRTIYQHSASSGPIHVGGSRYAPVPVFNVPSSLARPLFQQPTQLMQPAVSIPLPQQPAQALQQPSSIPNTSMLVSVSVPAPHARLCMSSGAVTPTPSVIPSQHSAVAAGPTPPSQQNILHPKPTVSGNTMGAAFAVASAPVTSTTACFPTQRSGHGAVNHSSSVSVQVQNSSTTLVNPLIASSSAPQSAGCLKTYARTEAVKVPGVGKKQTEAVTSEAIPTSIMPEGGGVIERATTGNQSIATYRCIICAKAFMTLDALRFHVKQVCRPGLSADNSVAVTKDNSHEAGVETSTVFQCMRCFELCISEAGIREHKLVCSKGFKAKKSKPKSKAKPRVANPESEEATEAKVQELLNKCLGENREKLLQEAEAQAARQASAKKKLPRKRLSVDEEPADIDYSGKKSRLDEASSLKNTTQNTFPDYVRTTEPLASACVTETVTLPTFSQCTTTIPSSQPVTAVSTAAAMACEPPSASSTEAASQSHSATETVMSSVTTNNAVTASFESNMVDDKSQSEEICDLGHASADVENGLQAVNDYGADGAVGQPGFSDEPQKSEPSDNVDSSCVRQKLVQRSIPNPQYKMLSGSCGRTFFKCVNCGQTLCSMESLTEHWRLCIAKKPLPVRVGQESREKKAKIPADGSKTVESSEKVCSNTAGTDQLNKQASSSEATMPEEALKLHPESQMIGHADHKDRLSAKECGMGVSATSLVKQSVVLLEKINLPEKSSTDAFRIVENADNEIIYAESSEQLPGQHSSKGFCDVSPVVSLKRCTFKDSELSGKTCRIQHSSPTVKKDVIVKVISKDNKQAEPISKEHQSQNGDNKYCSVCKRSFGQDVDFVQHLASTHLKLYTLQSEGSDVYVCHLCNQAYSPYNQYISHVAIHSQVIIQRFEDKAFSEAMLTECKVVVTDMNAELAGHPKKPYRQNSSPRNVPEEGNEAEAGGYPVMLNTAVCKRKTASSPVSDRRSSGRAAQKQALNKIYISSLGMTNWVEPVKDNTKRKNSCDEAGIATNKPKRSRLSESVVDFGDSEEDLESSDETEDGDAFAKTSDDHDTTRPSTLCHSKAGEKASMGSHRAQTSAKHGSHKSSHCPHNGARPLSDPKTSSHPPLAPKKPSFIDSFLSFVNSRSPEAPLPLYSTKRRHSHMNDNLESSTATSSVWRRSSCEERMMQSTSTQRASPKSSPAVKSALESLPESDSVCEGDMAPKDKSSSVPCVPNSNDYRNVYFYGEFEKQLTQECRVNLGHRVKPDEVSLKPTVIQHHDLEEPAISVKECIVNLGPKVNAAALMKSVQRGEEQKTTGLSENRIQLKGGIMPHPGAWDGSGDEADSDTDTEDESDSDTVVASCSALSPVRDAEDTVSLDGMPLTSNPGSSSAGCRPVAGVLCVGASRSDLSQPTVLPPQQVRAGPISAAVSQAAEGNLTTTTQTSWCDSSAAVAVSVTTLDSAEVKDESISIRQPGDQNGRLLRDQIADGVRTTTRTAGDVKEDDVSTGKGTIKGVRIGNADADDVIVGDAESVDTPGVTAGTCDTAADNGERADTIVGDADSSAITADDAEISDTIIGDAEAGGIIADCTVDRLRAVDGAINDDTMTDDMLMNGVTTDAVIVDRPVKSVVVHDFTEDHNSVANSTLLSDTAAITELAGDIKDSATLDDITSDRATSEDFTERVAGHNTVTGSIMSNTAAVDCITPDNVTITDNIADVMITDDDDTADDTMPNNVTAADKITVDLTVDDTTEDHVPVNSKASNVTVDEDVSGSVARMDSDNIAENRIISATTTGETIDNNFAAGVRASDISIDSTMADGVASDEITVDTSTAANIATGGVFADNTTLVTVMTADQIKIDSGNSAENMNWEVEMEDEKTVSTQQNVVQEHVTEETSVEEKMIMTGEGLAENLDMQDIENAEHCQKAANTETEQHDMCQSTDCSLLESDFPCGNQNCEDEQNQEATTKSLTDVKALRKHEDICSDNVGLRTGDMNELEGKVSYLTQSPSDHSCDQRKSREYLIKEHHNSPDTRDPVDRDVSLCFEVGFAEFSDHCSRKETDNANLNDQNPGVSTQVSHTKSNEKGKSSETGPLKSDQQLAESRSAASHVDCSSDSGAKQENNLRKEEQSGFEVLKESRLCDQQVYVCNVESRVHGELPSAYLAEATERLEAGRKQLTRETADLGKCRVDSDILTETHFDQFVHTSGRKNVRKESPMDLGLLDLKKGVSNAFDDECKENIEYKAANSGVGEQLIKISVAETEDINRKSDSSQIKNDSTKLSSDLPTTCTHVEPVHQFEVPQDAVCSPNAKKAGEKDMCTDQSLQPAVSLKESASTLSGLECEQAGSCHRSGSHENIRPVGHQPSRNNEKADCKISLCPELDETALSLEPVLKTKSDASEVVGSAVLVDSQREAVCGIFQGEGSPRKTEKKIFAELSLTTTEEKHELHHEQDHTKIEQSLLVNTETLGGKCVNEETRSVEGCQLRRTPDSDSIHIHAQVGWSCAASVNNVNRPVDKWSEEVIYSHYDQDQSSLNVKQSTTFPIAQTVQEQSEDTSFGERTLDDEGNCNAWDTGEDEVNVIDLPTETQAGDVTCRSVEEKSVCLGETSEPSFEHQHEISNSLDLNSEGEEVTEAADYHACCPLTEAASSAATALSSLGTVRLTQRESDNSDDEAVRESDDFSLDFDPGPVLQSSSAVDTKGQVSMMEKSPGEDCKSPNPSDANSMSSCQCSNSLPDIDSKSVQHSSNTVHADDQCRNSDKSPDSGCESNSNFMADRQCLNSHLLDVGSRHVFHSTAVVGCKSALSGDTSESVGLCVNVLGSTNQPQINHRVNEAEELSALSHDRTHCSGQMSSDLQVQEEAKQDVENGRKMHEGCWLTDVNKHKNSGFLSLPVGNVDSSSTFTPMEMSDSAMDTSSSSVLEPPSASTPAEMKNYNSGASLPGLQKCNSVHAKSMCEKSLDSGSLKLSADSENQKIMEGKTTSVVESASVQEKPVSFDSSQVSANYTVSTSDREDQDEFVEDGFYTAESSAVKHVASQVKTDSSDLDNDLPELCIVPDEQGTVIKRNASDTKFKTAASAFSSNGQQETDSVSDPRGVKSKLLQQIGRNSKFQTTYFEIKKEKVEVEVKQDSEPVQLESPTSPRKPLLGVKSLRRVHKPEPFVWDVDGEEDCRKRQRNERSQRAFRSKMSVGPFSWDPDCYDQNMSTTSAETAATGLSPDVEASKLYIGCDQKLKDVERDTHMTCEEKLQSDGSSGKLALSRTQNERKNADTARRSEKCIKLKTLTTSGQGRLMPRLRETVRSGSCEKAVSVSSKHGSSTGGRNVSRRQRPLRKSRSCDIEYNGMQSEQLVRSSSRVDLQQQMEVVPTSQNTKFRDEDLHGARSLKNFGRASVTVATAPRKRSCKQHASEASSSKVEGGTTTSSPSALVGKTQTRSRHSAVEIVEKRLGEVESDFGMEAGNETDQQHFYGGFKSTKSSPSKDGGINKVSGLGIHPSSKAKTAVRQMSSASDCLESSGSPHSSAKSHSRDGTACIAENSDDNISAESSQLNLKTSVQYVRNRHFNKSRSADISHTSKLHQGNKSPKNKRSTCKANGPRLHKLANSRMYGAQVPKRLSDSHAGPCEKYGLPKNAGDLGHSSGGSPSPNQNPSEQQYLTATVRRRNQPSSWRTVVYHNPRRPRIAVVKETPQYEIIRVEPVASEISPDQQKTRSCDKEQAPRTVHTRMCDFSPRQRPEPAKVSVDQKWQMNRHFTPSEQKKIKDPLFPFSFTARTQKHK